LGLAILRLVLILHALAVLAQAVFAGEFLSGVDSPVKFHEFTGWVVLSLAAMQLAAAAALLRSNITSLWLVFGSVFVLLGEGLQIGTGYGRFLNVHIPLAVIVFGVVTWQTVSVFLKRGNEI